ncbi:MAG: hypothetical protein GY716_24830 [bacterium]|nr:hypothetical protein [bacterium]
MHRKELNERSPLRVLEQSTHGGLGRGNLGVIVARHGVGKTAFLVGVALDDLLRERNVLHVALDVSIDRVCTFYDEIFNDLVHTQKLEDVWQARLGIERHRRIVCYAEGDFTPAKLRDGLGFWKDHGAFEPDAIIIEGHDFSTLDAPALAELKSIAGECNAEMWMSAATTRAAERDERGVPEPVAQLVSSIDVVLGMAHDGNAVHVQLHKDHDNPVASDLRLALDPTTMLLVKE